MPKDWEGLTDDGMPNFEDSQTGIMDRYGRILQHRSNESTLQLARQLNGLTETAYRASQALQEEADALIKRLDAAISRADEAIENARVATQKQRRQRKLMTALTVALVFATVLFTAINVVRTYQAHRGNQVHARIAASAMEEAVATRDANDPQRKLAGASTVDRPRQ